MSRPRPSTPSALPRRNRFSLAHALCLLGLVGLGATTACDETASATVARSSANAGPPSKPEPPAKPEPPQPEPPPQPDPPQPEPPPQPPPQPDPEPPPQPEPDPAAQPASTLAANAVPTTAEDPIAAPDPSDASEREAPAGTVAVAPNTPAPGSNATAPQIQQGRVDPEDIEPGELEPEDIEPGQLEAATPVATRRATGSELDEEIPVGPEAELLRLVLAHDVVGRQPVDPAVSFPNGQKVSLFIEARNEGEQAQEVRVTWEDVATGRRSPPVRVAIPQTSLHRTRAYRTLSRPGDYLAVVMDTEDQELAVMPFTIEP